MTDDDAVEFWVSIVLDGGLIGVRLCVGCCPGAPGPGAVERGGAIEVTK